MSLWCELLDAHARRLVKDVECTDTHFIIWFHEYTPRATLKRIQNYIETKYGCKTHIARSWSKNSTWIESVVVSINEELTLDPNR